jgi:hypothetical protein
LPIGNAPVDPEIGGALVDRLTPRVDAPSPRFQGLKIGPLPGQQFPRPRSPQGRDVISPKVEVTGLFDNMVLALEIVHGQAESVGLHVERLGFFRSVGCPVTVLDMAPVTYSVFVSGSESPNSVASRKEGDRKMISFPSRGASPLPTELCPLPTRPRLPCTAVKQSGGRHAGTVRSSRARRPTPLAVPSTAARLRRPGIQERLAHGERGQRVVAPIGFSNFESTFSVGTRRSEGFNPGMLIGENGLCGELSANLVRLFCENDI